MKILVFLHGTIIMHKSAEGKSRKQRVKQSTKHETSVLDYGSYVPIDNAAKKLRLWNKQGAKIYYLSSHTKAPDVAKDKVVLKKFEFPKGRVLFRKNGLQYKDIAEKTMPDVLIEDDCESIGGKKEMTITNVNSAARKKIKSIVVKEFSGIDKLPNDLDKLLKCKN